MSVTSTTRPHRHLDRRPGPLERRVLRQAHGHRYRARQVRRVRRHARDRRRDHGVRLRDDRVGRHERAAARRSPPLARLLRRRGASRARRSRRPRIEADGDEEFTVTGDLTIHGVTARSAQGRGPGRRRRPVGQRAGRPRDHRPAQPRRLRHEVQPGPGQRQHARVRQGQARPRHLGGQAGIAMRDTRHPHLHPLAPGAPARRDAPRGGPPDRHRPGRARSRSTRA